MYYRKIYMPAFFLQRQIMWLIIATHILFTVFLVYSSNELTSNFGETSKMSCGVEDSTRAVSWFKNGKIISETPKTHLFRGTLYIFCLESSDTGEYVCKDKVTLSFIDSHSLTVKNPGMALHDTFLLYISNKICCTVILKMLG